MELELFLSNLKNDVYKFDEDDSGNINYTKVGSNERSFHFSLYSKAIVSQKMHVYVKIWDKEYVDVCPASIGFPKSANAYLLTQAMLKNAGPLSTSSTICSFFPIGKNRYAICNTKRFFNKYPKGSVINANFVNTLENKQPIPAKLIVDTDPINVREFSSSKYFAEVIWEHDVKSLNMYPYVCKRTIMLKNNFYLEAV